MAASYKPTDDSKLTSHDALQRQDSGPAKPEVVTDPASDSSSFLSKKKRLLVIVSVLVFLAIAFIVLICLVVLPEESHSTKTKYCTTNSCMYGTCIEGAGNYTCTCIPGYTGSLCDFDINECEPNPCGQGKCSEGVNRYDCECDKGFEGVNCEINVNECISNMCVHGVCVDGIDSFSCSCYRGYTGPICQTDIDDCTPCMHGKCTDGNGTYTCECLFGYNGTNCDQAIDIDFFIGPITNNVSTVFVNYTLVFGLMPFADLRACATTITDNDILAARVNQTSGECAPLTWDWGSDPQYEEGYAYIRKGTTIEIFDKPIDYRFQWLLPGTFGVGGRIDFFITVPYGTTWTGFEMMIIDTTQFAFHTYDDDPEVLMVYIQIEQHRKGASVHCKIWANGWANKQYLSRTSVADGNPHKFTFIPTETLMQIRIDDIEIVEYTHVTDPTTAKQLGINPYSTQAIELHNITFVGTAEN